MGTVTRPDRWVDRQTAEPEAQDVSGDTPRFGAHADTWIMVAAIAAPITTAALLIPWRGQLDTADNACFWWW